MAPVTRRPLLVCPLLLALPALRAHGQAHVLQIGAVNKYGVSWVAAQLFTEIAKLAKMAMEIKPLPSPRVTRMALAGEVDGELIRIGSYGNPYPQLLRVEPPYYRIAVRAYSMAARNAQVQTAADLQHYSLGAIRGLIFTYELTENHPALTLTQDSLQMFRMLQAGRVDVVLDTSVGARTSLESLGIREVMASVDLARYDLFLYLHVQSKEYAPRLSDAIRRMKASGELERLITRYETELTPALVERFVGGTGSNP